MRYFKLIIVLLTATCVSVAREKQPVSVTINTSAERIKASVVAVLLSNRYRIVSDTPYQIVLAKDITGFQGAMTQMLMGNSYSIC